MISFAIKLRPEVNQGNVKHIYDLAMDAQRRAAALNSLRDSLHGVADVFGQRAKGMPLLKHDDFTVDNVLIFVYASHVTPFTIGGL